MTDQMTHASARLSMPDFVQIDLWRDALAAFDRDVRPDLSNAPDLLGAVPLAAFGAALLQPQHYFKRAHAFLPKMASDQTQISWTGSSGPVLLETSLAFVNHVVAACGGPKALGSAQALDFGVGWGRLARLFLKYMPPTQLDGCDAWDVSLQHARDCGIKNRLVKSDVYLRELPFDSGSFDLIYAFSIFTHLSEKSFRGCLAGFSKMLKPSGKAIFTIRPNHYWSLRSGLKNQAALMRSTKFEFIPSNGMEDFGDTSVTTPWFKAALADAGLKLVGFEWSPVDALQVIAITERA